MGSLESLERSKLRETPIVSSAVVVAPRDAAQT
jgi:hypothetical protein